MRPYAGRLSTVLKGRSVKDYRLKGRLIKDYRALKGSRWIPASQKRQQIQRATDAIQAWRHWRERSNLTLKASGAPKSRVFDKSPGTTQADNEKGQFLLPGYSLRSRRDPPGRGRLVYLRNGTCIVFLADSRIKLSSQALLDEIKVLSEFSQHLLDDNELQRMPQYLFVTRPHHPLSPRLQSGYRLWRRPDWDAIPQSSVGVKEPPHISVVVATERGVKLNSYSSWHVYSKDDDPARGLERATCRSSGVPGFNPYRVIDESTGEALTLRLERIEKAYKNPPMAFPEEYDTSNYREVDDFQLPLPNISGSLDASVILPSGVPAFIRNPPSFRNPGNWYLRDLFRLTHRVVEQASSSHLNHLRPQYVLTWAEKLRIHVVLFMPLHLNGYLPDVHHVCVDITRWNEIRPDIKDVEDLELSIQQSKPSDVEILRWLTWMNARDRFMGVLDDNLLHSGNRRYQGRLPLGQRDGVLANLNHRPTPPPANTTPFVAESILRTARYAELGDLYFIRRRCRLEQRGPWLPATTNNQEQMESIRAQEALFDRALMLRRIEIRERGAEAPTRILPTTSTAPKSLGVFTSDLNQGLTNSERASIRLKDAKSVANALYEYKGRPPPRKTLKKHLQEKALIVEKYLKASAEAAEVSSSSTKQSKTGGLQTGYAPDLYSSSTSPLSTSPSPASSSPKSFPSAPSTTSITKPPAPKSPTAKSPAPKPPAPKPQTKPKPLPPRSTILTPPPPKPSGPRRPSPIAFSAAAAPAKKKKEWFDDDDDDDKGKRRK